MIKGIRKKSFNNIKSKKKKIHSKSFFNNPGIARKNGKYEKK